MTLLRVGSTFSGIGGLDLAFERHGHRVLWTSEVDAAACRVLADRFPTAEPLGSITALDELLFPPAAIDVLVGGPPCQDLSIANTRRAGLDGSRSGLFHAYAATIDRLRPRWFVMEQVPGLLTANDGADLRSVLEAFAALGYHVGYRRRDTRDDGPPQRRERLIFVGHASDAAAPSIVLEHGTPSGMTPLEQVVDVSVDDDDAALEPKHAAGILQRLARPGGAAPAPLLTALERAAGAPHGDEPLEPAIYRKSTRARSAEVGETWVPATYANTLNLNDVGPARCTLLVVTKSGQVRTLTVEEAEAMHGFPPGWTVAAGSLAARWARLGNAVSVPVAQRVADGITEYERQHPPTT